MAANPLITCIKSDASFEEILNTLHVKDAAGNVGLRYMEITAAAADIDPVVGCGGVILSPVDVLRRSIQLDGDSKPALVLIKAS